MLWQWSVSVIAELAASAILLVLAIYFPWRDLNRQARLTGVTLVLFCALWILSHALEIGLPVVSYKESLVGVQLVLGMMALTFWLFYILHYLGPRKLLTRRIYVQFGIIPLIAIIALTTNNVYGLMWTGVGIDSQNPYLPLQPAYGIVYWVCMVYIAMLILAGSFFIIWNIRRRRYGYTRESIYLLVAAVLPLIIAFIEVTGLLSSSKIQVGLTPWAACIGAIILIFNLPRFHLEQIIPIARDITFERIEDSIVVLDNQNRILDLNPAAEQLIGYRISDAVGLSIERIWPYKSTPMMSFNKMAKAGEELVFERDHKQRTYETHISSISDSDGHLTSQVVLITDITERKQAVEALKNSEAQYRLLADHMEDQVWLMDLNLKPTYISPSVEKLRGYTYEEIAQLPLDKQLTATSFQSAMEYFSIELPKALKDPTYLAQPLELEFYCKDGSTLLVESTFSQVRDENGKPMSLLGVGRNITERKKVDEKLRESEARYRLLANNMKDTVWLMDMNLKTTYQSPSVQNMRGFTPSEIEEMPLEKHLTPESLKIATDMFLIEMAKVEADPNYNFLVTMDLEFYRKNGATVWSENTFSLIRDENGKPIFILCEGRDITERKLSEGKLEKSYESLRKTLNDAIDTMAKIVETRDPYTAGHQNRVADLVTAIALEMKLEDTRIDQLHMAAVIHDIGKMYIPSDILNKPGKLSDIEFSLIRTHAQAGYEIVRGMNFPGIVAEAVLQHHERLDGSGYPNQIKGEDTLLEAKILAVADVVEAMSSHRPYRPALGIDKALEEISKNRGKLYDLSVVDTCLELFNDGKFEFK